MSPLWLYATFHINLAFSSIPRAHYPLILDRCYWPILEVAQRLGVPFGIEATGYSLEILEKTDPSFVQALKQTWEAGQIEVVGASYTQSIMPLIPAEANRENLRLGNEVYKTLLGRVPQTAYVNEQTFSSGLVDLYLEAGYKQLFMEWNNPARFNAYPPQTRYLPQRALNPDGKRSIAIVWNDSIAFQKFQRVLAANLSVAEYQAFLDQHRAQMPPGGGGFPFYGSDAEIIDYHPGFLEAEYLSSGGGHDLNRLVGLIEHVNTLPDVHWTTPADFAQRFADDSRPPLRLESPEYPLPCKKQPKYNPTRWAVSGRENIHLNSSCYARFQDLMTLRSLRPELESTLPWRYLLENWGSDFRTHTTEEKMQLLRQRAASLERYIEHHMGQILAHEDPSPEQVILWNPNPTPYNDIVTLDIQFPPKTIHGYPQLQEHPAVSASQIEGLGYYQDGSVRWVKCVLQCMLPPLERTTLVWESCEKPAFPANSARIVEDGQGYHVETEAIDLKLLVKRGGAVESLRFKQLDSRPWVGTIPHGTFEDIGLGADFYSGHFLLASKAGEKANDLFPGTFQLPLDPEACPIRIPVQVGLSTEIGKVWKTFYIYQNQPRVDLLYHFRFRDVAAASCRVGILTVLPDAFERETLAYSSANGGLMPERFALKGHHVTHSEPVSVSVSAQHGLGATQGWVAIEDAQKRLLLKTYPQAAYAMPMIHYEESAPGYFLRVLPSIGEFDDTSHLTWRGHHQVMFTWQGQALTEGLPSQLPPASLSSHVQVLPL